MVETSWKDSAKAKVDSLVEEAGESDEDHAELVALLTSIFHVIRWWRVLLTRKVHCLNDDRRCDGQIFVTRGAPIRCRLLRIGRTVFESRSAATM